MRTLVRLTRLSLGLAVIVWMVRQVVIAWVTQPLLGVLPWGELTGLRVSPLSAADAAAARALERRLSWAGITQTGGIDTGS